MLYFIDMIKHITDIIKELTNDDDFVTFKSTLGASSKPLTHCLAASNFDYKKVIGHLNKPENAPDLTYLVQYTLCCRTPCGRCQGCQTADKGFIYEPDAQLEFDA
jgi:hypothetical protein